MLRIILEKNTLLNFFGVHDGSYIFPESGRFGFFPGLLIGWNVTKEDFMQNVAFLNNLKLRASYGEMGNDLVEFNGALQEYAYLPLYALGTRVVNGQVVRSLIEPRVPNTDFTWEVAKNANIGLEGAMLNNKVTFEFDVFKNEREADPYSKVRINPPEFRYLRKITSRKCWNSEKQWF